MIVCASFTFDIALDLLHGLQNGLRLEKETFEHMHLHGYMSLAGARPLLVMRERGKTDTTLGMGRGLSQETQTETQQRRKSLPPNKLFRFY